MNTAENRETQQSTEMRGEVVGVERTVDGIEVMGPGGDTMEEETGVEAGAGRTIEEEVRTGMTKEGASQGRDEGAGAEAGREGTLKTGQVVGGAGMRKAGEVEEEVEIGTGEEEVTRKDRGAEKRESRRDEGAGAEAGREG